MLRRILLTLLLTAALSLAWTAVTRGLGGNLDRPQIAIPTVGEGPEAKPDATVKALYDALVELQPDFVGGWFVNAHSKLFFRGDAKQISAALERLATVEGAELQVRFSKARGAAERPFPGDEPADQTCGWSAEHNAWGGNPASISIVVFLGDPTIDFDELQLPAIHGRSRPAAAEKLEQPAVSADNPSEKRP